MVDETSLFDSLKGRDVQVAVVELWAYAGSAKPLFEIQQVRNGDMVTCDYQDSRVRVWYDEATGLVTQVIRG